MTISNNPPPYEAMSLHIEDLFALVSDTTAGAVVATDEQDAALDSLMDEMRTARKDADKERAAEKKPHDDAGKAVQARWKPLLDRCDAGVAEIKKLLTPYREAKQRAKDEAARKAREEAEQRQREAQEALRSSDTLADRVEAEERLKQAAKLTAVANKIDRSATGLRTTKRVELTDPTAFGRWAWEHRRDAYVAVLTTLAEKERDNLAPIPGIIIHHEKKAA